MIVRQPPRIVVVGAGYAGLGTALRLARQVGASAQDRSGGRPVGTSADYTPA